MVMGRNRRERVGPKEPELNTTKAGVRVPSYTSDPGHDPEK